MEITRAEGLAIQQEVVSWIKELLSAGDRVCVFENLVEAARPESLKGWGIPVAYVDGVTLPFVASGARRDSIDEVLRRGAWPEVGFIGPAAIPLNPNQELTHADVTSLSSAALGVLVGAFDDDAWVIWKRGGY